MKSQLKDNDIEMYSAHKERKSIVVERFIKTLENNIYKYMTSVSKKCILINQMKYLINTTIYAIAQLK